MTTSKELAQKAANLQKIIDQYLPAPSKMIQVCPDYVHTQTEVMWGGLWNEPGLSLQLRSIATITAQCVNGFDFGLHHQIRVGLTLGITPQKIKAMFVELMFYVGVPNTFFALFKAQEIIDSREEWKKMDKPLDAPWLDTVQEKIKRGRELVRKQWGEQADKDLTGSIANEMLPVASELVDSYHYGEICVRSPLEPKERMVSVLAALMSRGLIRQLKRHIGYALNVGMTKKEICEVFSQAGWYRGWPHVEDALIVAKEVFTERGI
jgi:4-carboxymuconolactone decarboxylase